MVGRKQPVDPDRLPPALNALGPDLWEARDSLRVGPIHFPLRMTVLRAADDRLVLWSPVALSATLRRELAAIGEVGTIVAPNAFHHLHLAAAVQAWPEARVVGVPGLVRKRPDVVFDLLVDRDTTLAQLAAVGLGGPLTVVPLEGCPAVQELVVVHRPSGSAVFTDTVFHIRDAPNLLSRWFWRLDGVWKRPALPRTTRWFARDVPAFRASLERVLELSWDRLIMAHGEVVAPDGKAPVAAWIAAHGGAP